MDVKCLLVYVIIMTTQQVINGHKLRPVYKKLSHLEDAVYAHRAHLKNEMQIFHNNNERKFLNRVVHKTLPNLVEKKLLDIVKSGVLDIAIDDYNNQRIDRMYHQHQLIKVCLNWTYRQLVGVIALVSKSNRESKELTRQIKSLQTSVNGFKSTFKEIREENVRLKQTLSGIENQVMELSSCFPSDTSCGVVKDRSTRVVSINTWDTALTTEFSSGYTAEDVGHDELLSTITPEVTLTHETPVLTTEAEKQDRESKTFSMGSEEHTDPAVHTLTPTTDVTDSFAEDLEDEKTYNADPEAEKRTSTGKTASETRSLSSPSGRETTTSNIAPHPSPSLTTITATTSTTHTDQAERSTSKTLADIASHPSPSLTTITATTSTTHTDQAERSTSKTLAAATVVTEALATAAEDRMISTTKKQTTTTRPGQVVRDILSLIKN